MAVYSNLVKEIRKYGGINNIVKISSMAAVETGPATTIGRIHRDEEKIIEESGIPSTFLRPPCVSAGDAKMSLVDARDVAAVSVQALTNDNQQHIGKAYMITAQEAISGC